jgi:hypothetical protein
MAIDKNLLLEPQDSEPEKINSQLLDKPKEHDHYVFVLIFLHHRTSTFFIQNEKYRTHKK